MKRALLIALGILVLLPLLAVLSVNSMLQSRSVRDAVVGAVQGATGGRTSSDEKTEVTIGGLWRLQPTLGIRNLRVPNPPGFSRPDLATIGRVEARVPLIPLFSHRVEVRDVVLDGVDVLFERDAAGRGNWEGTERPSPARPEPESTPASRAKSDWVFEVGPVTVENVRVALLGGPAVVVSKLVGVPSGGPVDGTFVLNGVAFAVKGRAEGLGRGQVTVTGGGLVAEVSAQDGGVVTVHARVADLAGLAPVAGRALPSVRDVEVTAQIGPGNQVSGQARAGAADLGSGLRLNHLEIAAPGMEQPVQAKAEGVLRALPFSAALNVGRLSALFGGGAVPVQVLVLADGATVSGQGQIEGGAAQGTVSARVPDLRRTGELAGVALPGLTELAGDFRLAPAPGGGVTLRGLRAISGQGDLGGDLVVRWVPLPSVRGSLVSRRLDLDALLVAGSPPPPPPSPAQPPVAGPPPAASTGVGARPLPFAALKQGEADVHLTVQQMAVHGAELRALDARVLLKDGRLRVDPLQVATAAGRIEAQITADAAAVPPSAAVTVLGPGLDAGVLAAIMGAPGAATGSVDLDVDVRAAGADMQAMGATLGGHAGLAVVDGDVDNRVLVGLFGSALRAANLPAEAGGRSRVRCFALRSDAAGGQVVVKTLALDASRVRMDGEGAVNLVAETVDLHVRPTIRIGSMGIAAPVHLTGPLRTPVATLERGAIAPGRVGISIGGGAPPDICGPALAAARDGRPGPYPK